ncbi:MAG: phosphatase PAP2 family protein [Lachnospiraceae bacterium]|nr:phosphatase PAP2 family protein [Lachnospiraceae bacterium]
MEHGLTFYFDWEVSLMEFLQSGMGNTGVTVAGMITKLGEEMILIAMLGFIYWCYDKEIGRKLGLNIVIGVVLNPLIKNVLLRRRPYFDNPGIKCLKPVNSKADIYDIAAQGYSFPSGHSMNSAIVFGSVAYYIRKNWITVLGVLLPLMVGITRFLLGVHYPTDVLVGWICGVFVVFLIPVLSEKVKNRYVLYIVVFTVSAIGLFYCRTNDYFTGLGIMLGFFLSEPFEKKYVNFENTRNVPCCILRMLGGFAVYFILNTLFKLPFNREFLESATTAAFIVRFFRYAIVTFFVIGVYPIAFRFEKRVVKNS